MLLEKSCLPSPRSYSTLFFSVNRKPRMWGAGCVLGIY